MGVYNCEETLKESIESIINQTYGNWELIICDDYSRDNTYEIAKEYQKQYFDKIKVIKNEKNLKLAATLNHCLKYVTGEYIARMDGDDISLPTRLEKQVEFLNKHEEYQVVGGAIIPFDENGEKGIRKCVAIPDKYHLIKNSPFAHPTIMMRKGAYAKLQGYRVSKEITRCEDIDLWFRFYAEGFKGYNLQIPVLKYRESIKDYGKRKIRYSFDTVSVCYRGYRLLNYPKKYYIFLLKPIICSSIPKRLMKTYHNLRDKNNKLNRENGIENK